jgi:hypothetical protein
MAECKERQGDEAAARRLRADVDRIQGELDRLRRAGTRLAGDDGF